MAPSREESNRRGGEGGGVRDRAISSSRTKASKKPRPPPTPSTSSSRSPRTPRSRTAHPNSSTARRRRGGGERESSRRDTGVDDSAFIDDQSREFEFDGIQDLLMDRTLHLHSLSPLHLPPPTHTKPSRVEGEPIPFLSPLTFRSLEVELKHYVNLRLTEGLEFFQSSGLSGLVEASLGGDTNDPAERVPKPSSKRSRIEMNKVGKVRMGWVGDEDFETGFGTRSTSSPSIRSGKESRVWAIQLEMGGVPAFETEGSSSSETPRPSELCQLILLPSAAHPRTEDEGSPNHISYPLLLTKSSSPSKPSNSIPFPSNNFGKSILNHSLEWLQKRFDCRISSGYGPASISFQLTSRRMLQRLAEIIVLETRGWTIPEGNVKPVELAFSFPYQLDPQDQIQGGKGEEERPSLITTNPGSEEYRPSQGPAPHLSTLTLTVPWDTCVQLLRGLDKETPLLPALSNYLLAHTSIPLEKLELTRVAIAGVNLGVGLSSVRIKIHRHHQHPLDLESTRLGKVLAFLRDLVDLDLD
ncbi:hypothetical protein IE53DRAFT_328016 [Violaceomyces palustris]|uniref:Uncharacterized protein n=1 Tax=Violaceomyces palustris TaxID=1673888 RepID=A0ACD0P0S0_9BASI|nr:hypothetical protein IE53DRAFT_328016 [Violaceomyces palustris]